MDRSGKNGMHKDEPVKDFVCIVAPSVTDKSYLVAMAMLIDKWNDVCLHVGSKPEEVWANTFEALLKQPLLCCTPHTLPPCEPWCVIRREDSSQHRKKTFVHFWHTQTLWMLR